MSKPWTDEESELLASLTPVYATWVEIARQLPSRSAEACRKRASRLGITHMLGAEMAASEAARDSLHPEIERYLQAEPTDMGAMFDALEIIQRLTEQADPVATHATLHIDTNTPIAIMFSSCSHLGSRYVNYPKFQEQFHRTIETPGVFWGIHGDMTDNFMTSFRNAQPVLSQLIMPKLQRDMAAFVIDTLAKKGRLLYGCAGNHERMTVKLIGEDLLAPHFQRHAIPYFAGKGLVDLYVGEERYVLAVAHEWPGSSYINPAHSQGRALRDDVPSADIIVGGHRHEYAYMERSHHLMEHDSGHFPSPIAHLIAVGTAAEKPDPYAVAGWSRGYFEWPMVCLYPDRHQVKRIYDWEDVGYFLRL